MLAERQLYNLKRINVRRSEKRHDIAPHRIAEGGKRRGDMGCRTGRTHRGQNGFGAESGLVLPLSLVDLVLILRRAGGRSCVGTLSIRGGPRPSRRCVAVDAACIWGPSGSMQGWSPIPARGRSAVDLGSSRRRSGVHPGSIWGNTRLIKLGWVSIQGHWEAGALSRRVPSSMLVGLRPMPDRFGVGGDPRRSSPPVERHPQTLASAPPC